MADSIERYNFPRSRVIHLHMGNGSDERAEWIPGRRCEYPNSWPRSSGYGMAVAYRLAILGGTGIVAATLSTILAIKGF